MGQFNGKIERVRHTDGWTDIHRQRPRLRMASRGNNVMAVLSVASSLFGML